MDISCAEQGCQIQNLKISSFLRKIRNLSGEFFLKSVEKSGSFLFGIYEVNERLSNEINHFIPILRLENTDMPIIFFLKINRNIFCQRHTHKIKSLCEFRSN